MTTQEVADKLVAYCRKGDWKQAQTELYGDNCVSVEPKGAPVEVVTGKQAILAKGDQWAQMVEEVHSMEVSEPLVAGKHFSITMKNEITFKNMGRQQMEEICVYQVEDGKICREQFFYPVAPQQG